MFLQRNVKKSGKNSFAKYEYFELSDIVPVKTEIFAELGLVDVVTFDNDFAALTLYSVEAPDQYITFQSPMRELDVKGANAIQSLGGVETYQRRYLYMMALDIVEADMFDATQGRPAPASASSTQPPFVTGDVNTPAAKSAAKDFVKQIDEIVKNMNAEDKNRAAKLIKELNNGSAAYRTIKDTALQQIIITKLKEEFPNV